MIIDNENHTMEDHIKQLCKDTDQLDIAVGYFYNNGFNLIKECLDNVNKIRIIMGPNTNQSTIDEIADINTPLGKHIDSGKIEIRIYETDKILDRKFHGKTWIFHGVDIAIIGSSNCSLNGLQKNKELNNIVDIKKVDKWFTSAWDKSTSYSPEKLRIMKKSFDKPKIPVQKIHKPLVLRPYQNEAISKVIQKLENEDKCKLIMACGTGKTLVSLKIMERIVKNNQVCVYFIPSISLIPQTLLQFQQNGIKKYQYHAVCSDKDAGKVKNDDDVGLDELRKENIESSTEHKKLTDALTKRKKNTPFIIFTVYNSWKVAVDGLKNANITPKLVLYDEAHRTAGKKDGFSSESVHKVKADKKIFMTATPRIFKNSKDMNVNSMDDDTIYGQIAYNLSFTEAVELGKLVPFRIVLPQFEKSELTDKNLAGSNKLKALWAGIKHPNGTDSELQLLQKVIAFHSKINGSAIFAGVSAKRKEGLNEKECIEYQDYIMENLSDDTYKASVKHVDSTMSALKRKDEIEWLKNSNLDKNECRILSNARCLQEGVDVPDLDGVAFMDPKRSPVDIIQAIGRVMRKPDGGKKEAGYVILPIPTFSGSDEAQQMRKDPTYKMITDVISSMLAHDDKLASLLNQTFLLNKGNLSGEPRTTKSFDDYLKTIIGDAEESIVNTVKTVMIDLVDKDYYFRHGLRLGEKAQALEEKLLSTNSIVKNTKIVSNLHEELKILINDSITFEQARKTLCQHAVIRPVFDQLFPESINNNPVSIELNKAVNDIDIDLQEMQDIYDVMKSEIIKMEDPIVKQEFIRSLYDSFFKGSDRKTANRDGIVYTPVEAVDFILNSVNDLLYQEFGKTLADNNVNIIDPFTGTGTFISRLLRSDILKGNLKNKYDNDIYCNEINLLAYYTAHANIESEYQMIEKEYRPFKNLSYTDTFNDNMNYGDLGLKYNEARQRLLKQTKSSIEVIVGNPPYSGGQKTANEDNQNVSHDELEIKIKNTYIKKVVTKGMTRSLYNSYVKAFRWASDRIGESGIIGFITPASFITSNIMSGMRKCLEDDFTSIYCFNLRGNALLSGASGRQTGDNIFKGSSKEAIAITILVKNKEKTGCNIHYKEIGDSLKLDEKLQVLRESQSVVKDKNWVKITPNKYYDWVDQRNEELSNKWDSYMKIGDKNTKGTTSESMFNLFSRGLVTSRDAWVYNTSEKDLEKNMKLSIDYFNIQNIKNFNIDDSKFAWTEPFKKQIKKLHIEKLIFSKKYIRTSLYRPFIKHHLYYDILFIDAECHIPKFFKFGKDQNNNNSFIVKGKKQTMQLFNKSQIVAPPPITNKHNKKNLAIICPDKIKGEFSVFLTNMIPDLEIIHHGQVFPIEVVK